MSGRAASRRAGVLIGFVAAALAVTAGPAAAHAAFVSSQPSPGAQLATAPSVVSLTFSEPLIEDLSRVTVIDPDGAEWTGARSDEREIEVQLQTTAQGVYVVEWKTVSPIDGHTLRGQYKFGVAAEVDHDVASSGVPEVVDLLTATVRGLEYAGLLGMLGLLTLAALAKGEELAWAPHGLHRWAVVAVLGGVATVAAEVALAADGSVVPAARSFLLAPSGIPRLARVVVEMVVAGATLRAARRAGGWVADPRVRWLTGLATIASLWLLAAAGHAAATRYGVLTDTGHLVAAGLWAGPILVMMFHRPPGGWGDDLGRALVAELTWIAL
ncbi:MAG: copper resistance CopC family protein, partial [Thermocrispum sp.]